MGHSQTIRLDNSYLDPSIDRLFEEYIKAIPELSIDDSIRLRLKTQIQEKRITELESSKDGVIAGLLPRLGRSPLEPHPFRPLSALMARWSEETLADAERWPDPGIVAEGLRLLNELARTAPAEVLLATDLHAGNVLRAQREPWLVIDPKPFVGDSAYDATQHLFNRAARLRSDADGTIRRFADLLGVDHERVRLWTFAGAAAEPRDDWEDNDRLMLARAIAP